jgi:hypothetical protein
MKTSALTLLPLTQFHTASGQYDGVATAFNSTAVKGPAYYNSKSAATAAVFLNGFVGTIEIQGTLDSDPLTATWVTLTTSSNVTPTTTNTATDITGNIVWFRASITNFTAGVITKITVAY